MSASSRSVTLPVWQDDNAVTLCPICNRRFHFLYRKHHCRRCGRVVCDQCSPHRIALPSQYIVRPPYDLSRYRIPSAQDPWADPSSATSALQATGQEEAEKVRVCKPCVPDPNYAPPPDLHRLHRRSQTDFSSPRRSPERIHPDRYRATHASTVHPARRANQASSYYARRTMSISADTNPHDATSPTVDRPTRPRPMQLGVSRAAPPRSTRITSGSAPMRISFQAAGSPGVQRTGLRPAAAARDHPFTSCRQQQQQNYDESSECPVCGTREPPFGDTSGLDTTARERHIADCVNQHLRLTSTPPATVAIRHGSAPANENTLTPSRRQNISADHSTPLSSSDQQLSSSLSTRARSTTIPNHQQRMLVYHATEKDCMDPSSASTRAECVICLEDFEAGDELARLECLCKFHKTCIRDWWESGFATANPNTERGDGFAASASGFAARFGRWGTCPTHAIHL